MPQTDTPPDFAELWQEWRDARVSTDQWTVHASSQRFLLDEVEAARALLDALTGDAALQALENAFWEHSAESAAAHTLITELARRRILHGWSDKYMGLLHGPEEVADGNGAG